MSSALRQVEQIREQRDRDRDAQAWQVRRGEILREGRPIFFRKLGERLISETAKFNSSLGLSGNDALTATLITRGIKLHKNGFPGADREIFWQEDGNEVRVETTIVPTNWGATEETTYRLVFDALPDGHVYLNEQNYCDCADQLLSDILRLFR